MKRILLMFGCLIAFMMMSCSEKETPWQQVFNGDNLDNWEKYLGPAFGGHEDLAATATPDNVFSVTELDGEKVIHISGEVFGSLATKESFSNYHARIVMKWGEKETTNFNCGLLYHSHGPLGASFNTFMSSVECQLKHGQMGEVYMIGTDVLLDAKTDNEDGKYYYNENAPVNSIGAKNNSRMISIRQSAENPVGEWNTIEIYCVGQESVHVVNGKVVMRTSNIQYEKDGQMVPLTGGRLQLQSEGGELFVKSVEIMPIKEIPAL